MKRAVHEAAQSSPYDKIDSFENCGRINSAICLAIERETNYRTELMKGYVEDINGNREPHMFVVVFDGRKKLVVDGAIDQFSRENESLSCTFQSTPKLVVEYLGETQFNYTPVDVIDQ